jgi:hypothetical protein
MTDEQLKSLVMDAAFCIQIDVTILALGRDRDDGVSNSEIALVHCHLHATSRARLLHLARAGWKRAHDTLCGMARFLTTIGDPLPLWLQEYVILDANLLAEQLPNRGVDPWENVERNIVIANAVEDMRWRHGLRATRNRATSGECACSVVTKALAKYYGLNMTEANVVAIWHRHRPRYRPEQ